MRLSASRGILVFKSKPKIPGVALRSHARSMVITRYGIAATAHALASQAGAEVLARGGSAADAAIAANAVLGVTEPMQNGIGGDLFVLYWQAEKNKIPGVNARGWGPKRLTIAHPPRKGGGKEISQPAIFYGENAYPVREVLHSYGQSAPEALAHDKESRRIYLPD